MLKYAIKSLIQDKSKLFLSVLGVSIAILLILVSDGISAGTEKQLTAYIDNSKADIFVIQAGNKRMLLAKSVIPAAHKKLVEKIEGVSKVASVNHLTLNVKINNQSVPSYLIGFEQKEKLGGPWSIVKGKRSLKTNETLIDKVIAQKYNLNLGDKIDLFNQKFKIVGKTEGTFSMISSIFFFDLNAFRKKLPPNTVSFLLIQKNNEVEAEKLARKIGKELKGVNVLTKAEFSQNERNVASKMGVELVAIMTSISIIAAIFVIALTTYSTTLERIRDFGVLKAMGASKNKLYRAVIYQALLSALMATFIGIASSFGVAQLLKVLESGVLIIISLTNVVRIFTLSIIIGFIAAYLPVKQISGIDPVIVFKS